MKKKEQVILLKDNKKLGERFEVKELKRGFVINYLLPRGEVIFSNQKNLSWVEKQKIQRQKFYEEQAKQAQELYQKINNISLTFALKKDEKGEPFGSVGFKEILQELEKLGLLLEKSQLLEFHPLNKIGENITQIKLSNELTANLKIIIK